MSLSKRWWFCSVLLALLIGTSACSRASIKLEHSESDYDASTVLAVADEVPAPDAAERPVADAQDLRHTALSDLRAIDDEGARIADLLTTEFPDPVRSVPFYVQSASFDGTPAWIVVEVWGSEGGQLDQTRIWVFDATTGSVLFTAAVN